MIILLLALNLQSFASEEINIISWNVESGGSSIIIKIEGDFPDDNETSDHRPVKGVFNIDTD